MQLSGTDQESFVADLRETATTAAKVDLALRAVAAAEGLEATEEDLDEEFAAVAVRVDSDVDTVRARIAEAGQGTAVRADIVKRKALDWLSDRATIVDEAGASVDRSELDIIEADDDTDDDPDEIVGETEVVGDDAATVEADTDTTPAASDAGTPEGPAKEGNSE
jgi:trigger factor